MNEARADLTIITQQLSELTVTLELIKESNDAASQSLPAALQAQLKVMVASCEKLVKDIEKTITACNGRARALRWTLFDKERVRSMSDSLEAFKGGLSLALDAANLLVASLNSGGSSKLTVFLFSRSIAKDIKNNTDALQQNTTELKRDTEQILQEIQRLRLQLPNDQPLNESRIQIETWLDNLTQYAETVVDGDSVDEDDTPPPIEIGENSENNQSSISSYSIRTVSRIHSAESISSNPEEESPTRRHSIASPVPSTSWNQDKYSTPQLIAALPCANKIICSDGNAERQICITLHDNKLVKIWSIKTKQLIKELRVPSSTYTEILICPTNPDIFILQEPVAVWNWVESREIRIVNGTWSTRFVPCSTLIYTLPSGDSVGIVDLDVSPGDVSTRQTVQLYKLGTSVNKDAASDRGTLYKVRFLSDNELVLLWRQTSSLKRLVRRDGKPNSFFEIVRLSSVAPTEEGRKASISERYSRSITQHARIISKFWLPTKLYMDYYSTGLYVVLEKRILVLGCWQKNGKERVICAVQLDTGKELFTYVCPKGFCISYKIWGDFITLGDLKGKHRVVSLMDGREVAIYDNIGSLIFETSDAFVSVDHAGSEIKFWETLKPQVLQDS
ncbi:hypothetical protein RRF57_003080 [Xylaria bambusicola]|uniref:Fungal N-terminal domain-containing protein n=1 Tax=Xylaria bambusicola TaxID=326684 RepID=A0AAN7YW52_9PEZI